MGLGSFFINLKVIADGNTETAQNKPWYFDAFTIADTPPCAK